MIHKHKQLGFSLIELMIGMLIGLIVTFVITSVFTGYEQQKRTTVGSSDAQTNGNIALFAFQKDAESAGYGLPLYKSVSNNPLNCPLDASISVDHDSDASTANVDVSASPILIEDGGTGSDKVTIRYGTAMQGGGSVLITGNNATGISIENAIGCAVGDVSLVIQTGATNTDCQFSKILTKPSTTKVTLANTTLASSGSALACLGNWSEFVYEVDANKLERNGQVIVSDIVDMQVQYGVSTLANSVEVTQWVNATGIWSKANLTTDTAANLTNRNRIKAIRVALVARNSVKDKQDVTDVCSSTSAANPTGLCAWDATSANPTIGSPAPSINLTADTDWKKYRYRVYETIIPIRNVIWQAGNL